MRVVVEKSRVVKESEGEKKKRRRRQREEVG